MMMFKDSSKVKNLTIHVDTGATIGPKGLPLVCGRSEELSLVQATVSFETSHDCKAKGIEVSFKAASGTLYYGKLFSISARPATPEEVTLRLEGEQVYLSKHWDIGVQFAKPGSIAKGTYTRQVAVLLDPTLPSSTSHINGWVKYEFEARLKEAKGFGIGRHDTVVTQEVWVLNSSVPAMGLIDIPVAVKAHWRRSVPFVVTLPSKTLCLDQVVPINIAQMPFITGTELEGQGVLVNSVNFVLQETRTARALYTRDVRQLAERFVDLTVNTGWEQSSEGWERTIYVSMPSSPALSASMTSRYLDVVHCLVVTIELRTNKIKTDRIVVNVDVDITPPRTILTPPPGYNDETQNVDAVLGIPTDLTDELPSYARYEA
ncbi:hypothetical protein BGZ99_005653 [Dissophora globulifera]|uniref:Arrestin C-terminal-like domain-containing protein n=1 Tax=Dissophora globulifera TaxID=979702 RepID=A0A9P6RX97_9FUNG|nr:hypothetical protein BGZ99_005653 [Dissophora globulifera]